jgi:hypothetical protein
MAMVCRPFRGFARERFEEDAGISPTYWLAKVRPDGRPQVMPVWTVWVDGAFDHRATNDSRARVID